MCDLLAGLGGGLKKTRAKCHTISCCVVNSRLKHFFREGKQVQEGHGTHKIQVASPQDYISDLKKIAGGKETVAVTAYKLHSMHVTPSLRVLTLALVGSSVMALPEFPQVPVSDHNKLLILQTRLD